MKSFISFLKEDSSNGTYVAVRPTGECADKINAFIVKHNIPNPIKQDELHVSILSSLDTDSRFTELGRISPAFTATPTMTEAWKTRDGKIALVVLLDSPQLVDRHNQIITEYKFGYIFDAYIPHLTLSYDIPSDLSNIPLLDFPLQFNIEYKEELKI